MAEIIKITRKSAVRGDDGHKIISVRLTNEMIKRLDTLAGESNRSRNEVINLLLEAAVSNVIVEGQKKTDETKEKT